MYKTVTTIILTILAVLFAMQNFDHVPIYFFWGKPLNIRMIFVIAIAGVSGYVIRHLVGVGREEMMKKQILAMRRYKNNGKNSKNGNKSVIVIDDDDEI
jgi:uncharacterized integral membrane protein